MYSEGHEHATGGKINLTVVFLNRTWPDTVVMRTSSLVEYNSHFLDTLIVPITMYSMCPFTIALFILTL